MAMYSRGIGRPGHIGDLFTITVLGDSTVNAALTAAKATVNTYFENVFFLKFTCANNWEVTFPSDGEHADGRIVKALEDNTNTWLITMEVYGYTDENSTWWPCTNKVLGLPYGTAPSLQDPFVVKGATYKEIKAGGSVGPGVCIALDDPTGYAHFII